MTKMARVFGMVTMTLLLLGMGAVTPTGADARADAPTTGQAPEVRAGVRPVAETGLVRASRGCSMETFWTPSWTGAIYAHVFDHIDVTEDGQIYWYIVYRVQVSTGQWSFRSWEAHYC